MGLLSGCAASNAYRTAQSLAAEGRLEEALAKYEQANVLSPRNVEYRIALVRHRSSVIGQLLREADGARRAGSMANAEAAYRKVQVTDPYNAMARQGLDALTIDLRHRTLLEAAETAFKRGSDEDYAEASRGLRTILAENPSHVQARALRTGIDERLASRRSAGVQLAESFRKPITLTFRDAPIKAIFDAIATVSGLNFFLDKDIRPDLKATVLAKDTSIADAIRVLLVTNQLEQKLLNENSILIYPNTPQKLNDYRTLTVRSFFLANADAKSVANTLKTIVKTQDIVVDERLGVVIMRDTPEAIRIAEKLVALQDLADPEVMLELEVLEIKRTRLLELGVRWPDQMTFGRLGSGTTPITLRDILDTGESTVEVGIPNFVATVRNEDQDANILANPRVRVRNKEKAAILIGDRVPVITTTSTSTGFVSESVSYVDVGLKLDVEPNIYLDNEVAIKVQLEVSSLVREVVSQSGTLSYQIGTRSASTILRLKDGETQILAGLINDEDRASANKVPGLGDIPILGRLFGSRKNDSQRSEIILSITPRLVRSLHRPEMLLAEFESGTATTVGSGNLLISGQAGQNTIEQPTEKGLDEVVAPASSSEIAASPSAEPKPAEAVPVGPVQFTWRAPSAVRRGEQFSLVLDVRSDVPMSSIPLLLGFDPRVLQVIGVEEGGFLKQGGAPTTFTSRVDPVDGKIYATAARQSTMGSATGVNGVGSLVTVTFKAASASESTTVELLSATPDPPIEAPLAVPVEHRVQINQ